MLLAWFAPCLASIYVMAWSYQYTTECKSVLDKEQKILSQAISSLDNLYNNYYHFPKEP